VDGLLRGIEKADVDVTKVVLREFAGQPFKADERPNGRRTQRADQIVERRLATGIPLQLRPSEDLDGEQIRFRAKTSTMNARNVSAFAGRPIARTSRSRAVSMWVTATSVSTRCTLRRETPASAF